MTRIMERINGRGKNNLIMCIVFCFTLLRLGLFARMPYYAIGNSGYDDHYLLSLADSIFNGNWLGKYNYTTLIKGVSYPLFVFFANLSGVSYSLLIGGYYVVSSGVFAFALNKIINNKVIVGMGYILLLYSPTGFSWVLTQRLYRNAIIFPSVLLVFSSILLVYLSRVESMRNQIFWMILSGLSFSFFYYIREDSIWLMPLFIVSLFFVGVWFLFFSTYEKSIRIFRTLLLVCPILIFLALSCVYRYTNYSYYGVWEINDRVSSNFATLMGNMIKIEDESNAGKNYWISKDTLERIINSCPSLMSNKTAIMNDYARWADDSGNVKGDFSIWAIREAFNHLGYYKDATTINDFCGQVNEELLKAVDDGTLSFDDAIHFTNQSRGIYLEELPSFLCETFSNVWNVITYRDAYTHLGASNGTESAIKFMQGITGVGIIEEAKINDTISGWIIIKNNITEFNIDIRNNSGEIIASVELFERQDVRDAYPEYNNSLYSGFNIYLNEVTREGHTDNGNHLDNYKLVISSDGRILDTLSICNTEDKYAKLYIENVVTEIMNTYENYSKNNIAISNCIIKIERYISIILFPVSLILFIILIVNYFRCRDWNDFEPVIILSGLIFSVFIYEFGVTVYNGWLGNVWFYSSGAVPLTICFEILCLSYGIMKFTKKLLRRFGERNRV